MEIWKNIDVFLCFFWDAGTESMIFVWKDKVADHFICNEVLLF